ncbi:hypothetical protein BS47DRAFT_1396642 [Hydnum rufescens UP504]|uniref:Uncharacterized protein n=1 Tax=Hydnum rufescens UP504 TaxID=1448309 RepID=A0A9P6AQP9_9AGAM|nr:hypothetical protein BS47DRAFT_1396642 [Hydnum rufescens UP504]
MPLQNGHLIDGWLVDPYGTVFQSKASSLIGLTMQIEWEEITVPHWSTLPPKFMMSDHDTEDVEDNEGSDSANIPTPAGPLYPPGTIRTTSVVWVEDSAPVDVACSQKHVERNCKKRERKSQNKKAMEERKEREWATQTSVPVQSDEEAWAAWNAPSVFYSIEDNPNAAPVLPLASDTPVHFNPKNKLDFDIVPLSQAVLGPIPSEPGFISSGPEKTLPASSSNATSGDNRSLPAFTPPVSQLHTL